jgi:hypothetical protein
LLCAVTVIGASQLPRNLIERQLVERRHNGSAQHD